MEHFEISPARRILHAEYGQWRVVSFATVWGRDYLVYNFVTEECQECGTLGDALRDFEEKATPPGMLRNMLPQQTRAWQRGE